MRSQSQLLTVTLVTLFTMALALSVALICISHFHADVPDEPPNTAATEQATSLSSQEPADSSELQPPDASRGLHFTSNGNGTCVLAGMGTCADACVVIPVFSPSGERVIAIAPMAFYGSTAITAVRIPFSVTEIGSLAFAACPNLVCISVSPDNPFYCDTDGVLFTADRSTLLLYPAMHAGEELVISAATVRVADMALYKCRHLLRIRYEGSACDWEAIRIGAKNYSLTAASKEFLGGMG